MKWLLALLWLTALALAGWTLWQLPLGTMLLTLLALSTTQYTVWVLLNAAILAVAVLRWQRLAAALNTALPVVLLFRLRQGGSAVNFLTPGPHVGGEPLQLYWLYRLCALPLHRATLVLGLDRFFEVGTNFSVLLAALAILGFSTALPATASLQVGAMLVVMLLGMGGIACVLLQQPQWLNLRIEGLAQRWQQHPRLRRIDSEWQRLGSELRTAIGEHHQRLWQALALSLLGWGLLLSELALLLHFTGVEPTALRVLSILIGMRLAMLLPTPGGIGTIEVALLWSFQLLQLPAAAALGLIALIRIRDAVVLVIGLWCLAHLRQTEKMATATTAAAPAAQVDC